MAELRGQSRSTFLSGEPRGIVGDAGRRRPHSFATARSTRACGLEALDQARQDRCRNAGAHVRVVSLYRPPAGALVASMPSLRSKRHAVSYGFGSLGDVVPSLAARLLRRTWAEASSRTSTS